MIPSTPRSSSRPIAAGSLTVQACTWRPAACARARKRLVAIEYGIWAQPTDLAANCAVSVLIGRPALMAPIPAGDVAEQTGCGSSRRVALSLLPENEVRHTRSQEFVAR